jgi:predicted nucleic acid-binding protein
VSEVVVDASVAVKWFLPEIHTKAACRLLSGKRELLAPDLIWAEVGNVLWKKVSRAEITAEVAHGILRDFKRFPFHIYASRSLLDSAWNLAERFRISVYDSLYVALAVTRKCRLVTTDRRLYNTFRGGPLASTFVWVEQVR